MRAAAALRLGRGEPVAVAESSAGGLISASLLEVARASGYYRGGCVVYTLDGAREMLGDDPGGRGATEAFARHLATSAAARLGADWGIGETGATGPSPNPYGDPPGHAWIAVSGPGGVRAERVLTGDADRARNMRAFADRALALLAAELA